MMRDEEIIAHLREIAARLGLGYSALAALADVSPSTMRVVMATGEMPRRRQAREAIAAFVFSNVNAKTRAEVQLTG
mgnify:CR=1 FL=1